MTVKHSGKLLEKAALSKYTEKQTKTIKKKKGTSTTKFKDLLSAKKTGVKKQKKVLKYSHLKSKEKREKEHLNSLDSTEFIARFERANHLEKNLDVLQKRKTCSDLKQQILQAYLER
jgi:hypothetical protein